MKKQGESIPDYVAALKQLRKHCEFGGDLQPRLRDAFVFGLANTDTQKRLLQKDNLNIDAAVSAPTAIEQANADAVELSRDSKPVNTVRKQERQHRRHRNRIATLPKPPHQPAIGAAERSTRPMIVTSRKVSAKTVEKLVTFVLPVEVMPRTNKSPRNLGALRNLGGDRNLSINWILTVQTLKS